MPGTTSPGDPTGPGCLLLGARLAATAAAAAAVPPRRGRSTARATRRHLLTATRPGQSPPSDHVPLAWAAITLGKLVPAACMCGAHAQERSRCMHACMQHAACCPDAGACVGLRVFSLMMDRCGQRALAASRPCTAPHWPLGSPDAGATQCQAAGGRWRTSECAWSVEQQAHEPASAAEQTARLPELTGLPPACRPAGSCRRHRAIQQPPACARVHRQGHAVTAAGACPCAASPFIRGRAKPRRGGRPRMQSEQRAAAPLRAAAAGSAGPGVVNLGAGATRAPAWALLRVGSGSSRQPVRIRASSFVRQCW